MNSKKSTKTLALGRSVEKNKMQGPGKLTAPLSAFRNVLSALSGL
jgi:hypothetical protein